MKFQKVKAKELSGTIFLLLVIDTASDWGYLVDNKKYRPFFDLYCNSGDFRVPYF